MGKTTFYERTNSSFERFFTRLIITVFVVLIIVTINLPVQARSGFNPFDSHQITRTTTSKDYAVAKNDNEFNSLITKNQKPFLTAPANDFKIRLSTARYRSFMLSTKHAFNIL